MHLDGTLPDSTLENWLQFYCPPDSSIKHQHHERAREHAELVARDAARKAAKKPVKRRAYPVSAGVSNGSQRRFQPQLGALTKKEQRMEQDLRAQENARASRRVPHLIPLRAAALRGGRRVYRKLSEVS